MLTFKSTKNQHCPEVKVTKDGKVLGFASSEESDRESMGGSEKVWDSTTKEEQAEIHQALNKMTFNKELGYWVC